MKQPAGGRILAQIDKAQERAQRSGEQGEQQSPPLILLRDAEGQVKPVRLPARGRIDYN